MYYFQFNCLAITFCNILNQLYAAEINVMEQIFNTVSCNAFMICGDFNTSFSRDNAQTTHLSDFMHRHNLTCTWGHSNSRPDFTYNNFALNHKSCIDHFIVSRNVYDNIHLNHVICDPTNLSNHNSIELVIDNFQTPINLIDSSCNILLSNQLTVIGVKLLKSILVIMLLIWIKYCNQLTYPIIYSLAMIYVVRMLLMLMLLIN